MKIPLAIASLYPCRSRTPKLTQAQDRLTALEVQHADAALDAELSGHGGALARLETELAQALKNVATLSAAHQAAVERDRKEEARQWALQQQSELRVCRTHLNARDKAAAAMCAALEQAIEHWHQLLSHSAKARAAIVTGKWPNMQAYIEFLPIKTLVEMELYRLGGDPNIGNRGKFPGSNPHNMSFLGNPSALPPLTDKICNASTELLDVLTGKDGA